MHTNKKRRGIAQIIVEAGGLWLLPLALLANILEGVSKVMIAQNGGNLVESISAQNPAGMKADMRLILISIAAMAVGIVLKDSLLGEYQERGMVKIRQRTVSALDTARMDWLNGRHTGELIARVSSDINALGGALRPVLIMGISGLCWQLIAIGYMARANWQLTLIIFSLVPVVVALQWLSSKPITSYRAAVQDALGDISETVFDTYGNLEAVKSLTLELDMKNRFSAAQQRQYQAQLNENKVVALLTPLSVLSRYLPQFMLILIGGLFVINGRLDLGDMIMFLALAGTALGILDNVLELITSIRKLNVAADRLVELWHVPKEREGGALESQHRPETVLAMDGACFMYSGGAFSLASVTLRSRRGGFVALVGESGSGKSTVMKLAAGLYEASAGRVELDGLDIKDWNPDKYRDRIAYVAQDTWLFSGTLRDNIACRRAGVTDSEVLRAVDAAGLSEFVRLSPGGLDTPVGERGVFLSGGQRQRIAIARALVKRADVLLLDEGTSALDQSMEAAVIESLLSQTDKPAVLMITHRLANARTADEIIVMRHGEVIERGQHQELVAKGGEYARLLAHQETEVAF